MKTMLTWLLITICLAVLVKDYLPRAKSQKIELSERDIAFAKRREAAAQAKVSALEQELEHSRKAVAETDAPLKRDSITYEYGRRHLDTANIDSVRKQLAQADTVIIDQRQKINALESDTAVKARTILAQSVLLDEKDDKYAALERLNEGIKAEIPTLAQRIKHDAAVAAVTAGVIGSLKLLFGG